MNRRDFLKSVSIGTAVIALPGFLKSAEASGSDKPNIILIMADDLGYGDLSCYGSKVHKTPNIDSMAKGGIKFTDFHSNGALCTPTRTALLTGRYQQRAGIESVLSCKSTPNAGLDHKEVTFAEVLKPAGYETGMYGKWHLGIKPKFNPVHHGFDEYVGHVAGGSDYHSHINRSGEADWWKNDKLQAEEGYTTDLLSDHACRFIETNKDKPFCVYVPYQAVHFPFQGPEDDPDRLIGGNYWSDAKYGRRYKPIEDRMLAYKEMVESMDAGVGRILETVKKLGLEKKTLVFFTSDNGAYSWVGSNLPLSGQKSDLLEGGHRVPAVAYWPGRIKAGTLIKETVLTMDLFPTIWQL
ncbi:MAG: sulfatase-like hydrolase/transferase [Planctomycetota bacterium]|jgi:arylsulfatase A-like enzyme